MPRSIEVWFEGAGSGEQPLTWAQNDVWQGMVATGKAATLSGVHELPPGTTLDDRAELFRFILSRHQALRTRLRLDPDGTPYQVCSASGQASFTVVEAGDAEPGAVAEQLRLQLEREPFDYQNDWPVRMAVVTSHGVLSHQVTVYLHLMVDGGGIAAVVADVAARDPLTGAPAGPVTALQPLELARRQSQPAALRQSAASLRHLEHVLRAVSPRLLGEPEPGRPAEHRKIRFVSPATALAARRIAEDHDVSPSTALSAMFAVGLARQIQNGTVWAMVLVSNRFRPGLADSVSQLVQSSPFLIEVADVSLATVVARARGNLLHTYKNAYYDGRRFDEVVERVSRERGERIEICCYYNDRREGLAPAVVDTPAATDEQLRQAPALSSWSELREHALPAVPLFVNLDHPPHGTDFQVSFDTRHLDYDAVLAFLREIEAAAVQTALTPDAPTGVPSHQRG